MDSSREQKHKACDLCKKRKVRCSGRQPCQNCLRAKEHCIFTSPHGRLANAERRAEKALERVRLLELAWAKYLPQVPLETAIESVRDQGSLAGQDTDSQSHAESPDLITLLGAGHVNTDVVEKSPDISEHDFENERPNSLEWNESPDLGSLADSIGSLSIQPQRVGYMGPQSGNALLRSLQPFFGSSQLGDDEYTSYWNTDTRLSEKVLKSSAFTSRCVDAYFKYYHHAYPILHEGEFRAQWMGVLPKPQDGSWPILYNVVLAIGAHSSDFSRQNGDLYFYEQARQHLSWGILHCGSLSLVQALTLLANYLQKRNRPNSGFTLLGTAMNMAQGIGLHREFGASSISVQAMEIRRRVWWTLFIFDSGARLTFGRPTLTVGGVNVALPCNVDDADLPADVQELPASKDYMTVSSSLIWQIKLAMISNRANEQLLQPGSPNISTLSALGNQVLEWREQLPPYMTEGTGGPVEDIFEVPRMVLLWRSMHLRIVIFRPFLLDSIKQRRSLDLSNLQTPHAQCIATASECIESITFFWAFTNSHHGSLVWYACYWLVTAVFVHITCLLYDPQGTSSSEWRRHIEMSRTSLEAMSSYELTAARALRMIDQLLCLVPPITDTTFLEMNEQLRVRLAESWTGDWTDIGLFQEESPTTGYAAP